MKQKSILYVAILTSILLPNNQLLANDNPIQANPLDFWLPLDTHARINFSLSKQERASIIIKTGHIQVRYANGKSQSLSQVKEGLNNELNLQIDDFNFDGRADIIIAQAYGYGGVNIFSDLFLFDNMQGLFKKHLSESNIEADASKQELRTGQRSGPHHYTKIYRYKGGKAYSYRETVTISHDLEKVVIKNVAGKTLTTAVVEATTTDSIEPAIRQIITNKAYLYSKPQDTAKTRMYVIKDDQVRLLNTAGDWNQWLLIEYKGKKPSKNGLNRIG